MKTIDFKSVVIGVLFTIIIFITIGATTQNNNLGDITATSVNIIDENGRLVGRIGSVNNAGTITLIGANREPMVMLLCEPEGGSIYTYNANKKYVSYLGAGSDGFGMLSLRNKDESRAVYLGGSETGNGGLIQTFGNNQLTSYVGTVGDGGGALNIFNAKEEQIAYLGASTGDAGMLEITNPINQNRSHLSDKKLYFFNKFGEKIMMLGNVNDNGYIGIADKYGEPIWGKSK